MGNLFVDIIFENGFLHNGQILWNLLHFSIHIKQNSCLHLSSFAIFLIGSKQIEHLLSGLAAFWFKLKGMTNKLLNKI